MTELAKTEPDGRWYKVYIEYDGYMIPHSAKWLYVTNVSSIMHANNLWSDYWTDLNYVMKFQPKYQSSYSIKNINHRKNIYLGGAYSNPLSYQILPK